MRILITGGAGFVGSHAAEYFAKKNNEIIVIDNLMRSKIFSSNKKTVEYNWEYLANYTNIKRIKGDIRNKEDVIEALNGGVDVVIHTAAQPGVVSSIKNPEEDFSINAFGTFNVLELTRKISPQACFIYCSTNKVYGENVSKIATVENSTRYQFSDLNGISEAMPIDLTPHTPYGVSKYIGDIYTQEYHYIYGMKTAVFRMSCIYGTRQFGFEDQGWVAWFVIATITDQPITIYGDGKQVRDLLYVEDLIEAMDLFIQSDIKHAVWNVGGGNENTTSLLEFIEFLEKKLNKKPKIFFSDWRVSDQKVYISDITKIKKQLKWNPKISIPEGASKLISWVEGNKNIF